MVKVVPLNSAASMLSTPTSLRGRRRSSRSRGTSTRLENLSATSSSACAATAPADPPATACASPAGRPPLLVDAPPAPAPADSFSSAASAAARRLARGSPSTGLDTSKPWARSSRTPMGSSPVRVWARAWSVPRQAAAGEPLVLDDDDADRDMSIMLSISSSLMAWMPLRSSMASISGFSCR
ncbi:hypothetical protein PoMZ_03272 [Pyricularia oryzae]|uniref:Uncharacterized protein n=1 Tax=Pyricularia oryzae TaxID=318829 RepID=A0A4P7N9C6_PYROR|nr:hypothetical protein PoMZ_03272 [Pyricularia oryzae]